jgi:hypothetical protein
MQLSIGLVSDGVPAHFCSVHARKVLVFAVTTDTSFADAVVQFTTLIFNLIDCEALTDVSAVDDQTLGHA